MSKAYDKISFINKHLEAPYSTSKYPLAAAGIEGGPPRRGRRAPNELKR